MTDDQELDTRRSGLLWTEDDYQMLADGLRAGRVLEDLAVELQRRPSAVRGRLHYLVPFEAEVARSQAAYEQYLREHLDSYDWLPVVQQRHTATGIRFWPHAEIAELTAAWQRHEPLSEVAERYATSEMDIARQCLLLGLATTVADVADHMPPTTDGVVDVRARMTADRAATAVWILIVDGLGPRVAAFDGQRRHVSLHPHYDAAQDRLAELIDHAGRRVEQTVRYSITERTLGENTTGTEQHQAFETAPDNVPPQT